jgi:alpha-D-ribose 1-methylphosphonate 5-triphosphate diphosphatase
MQETILTNASLVLDGEVRLGSIVIRGDRIAVVDGERSHLPGAIDFDGDYLAPGLIEMHTDNAERHFEPRPGVFWPDNVAAIINHDVQMAAAGVTTVYDSVSAGYEIGHRREIFGKAISAIEQGIAADAFRIEHRIHIRCELTGRDLVSEVASQARNPLVQLISLMDHTPGQRQWRDLDALRRFHVGSGRRSAEDHERDVVERMDEGPRNRARNLPAVLELFAGRGVVIATHDDTSEADVEEAVAVGAAISEFPTTLEAAKAAKARGLVTIAGAPNVVRGGSHSGGVSVAALAEAAALDGLSSDYVPSSLLQAVVKLCNGDMRRLPANIALVTANVGDALSLHDRGRLEAGLRADLVRFRVSGTTPIVREVWCKGARVC